MGLTLLFGVPALLVVVFLTWAFVEQRNAYKPPPADSVPLPADAEVVVVTESCGSGGCPDRILVVLGEGDASTADDLMAAMAATMRVAGWSPMDDRSDGWWRLGEAGMTARIEPFGSSLLDAYDVREAELSEDVLVDRAVVVTFHNDDLGVGRW